MPYQSYQLWDTARAKTTSGSFSQACRKVRAVAGLRSGLGRSARLADADTDTAAYLRAAG
jgi:hypothetical protein